MGRQGRRVRWSQANPTPLATTQPRPLSDHFATPLSTPPPHGGRTCTKLCRINFASGSTCMCSLPPRLNWVAWYHLRKARDSHPKTVGMQQLTNWSFGGQVPLHGRQGRVDAVHRGDADATCEEVEVHGRAQWYSHCQTVRVFLCVTAVGALCDCVCLRLYASACGMVGYIPPATQMSGSMGMSCALRCLPGLVTARRLCSVPVIVVAPLSTVLLPSMLVFLILHCRSAAVLPRAVYGKCHCM